MFDQYLEQLASPDVSERRQAIIALGKSADPRALAPLANIYKNDPDPTLRELALKAGRYLKGLTASMPSAATSSSAPVAQTTLTVSSSLAIEAAKPELKPKEVTYADRQRAKGRVDYAIGLVAEGRNEKALSELVDAIRINPELATDQVALNLASSVTGIVSTAEAMDVVVKEAQELTKKRSRIRESSQIEIGDSSEMSRPNNGGLVLLITILVLFIFTVVSTVLLRLVFINQLTTLGSNGQLPFNQVQQLQRTADSLRTLPPSDLFVGTAVQIVGSLINLAIVFGVGSMLFNGSGTFVDFFNRVLRVRVVMTLIIFAEVGVWYFTVMRATDPTVAMSESIQTILGILGLTYLVEIIWEIVAVARAHNIGVFTGCISIFVGLIVSAILLFVFILTLAKVLSGTL